MHSMNELDITYDTFRSEVLNSTDYPFEEEQLQEFYADGYTTFDTLDWAEWRLECAEYKEMGF
jgi:hypothetical protein